MDIKMIAVDMDGTFLDDQKRYDKERFLRLHEEMQVRKIKFVVASGNQYYQLKTFFPEIEKEISFVAENGVYVVHNGQEINSIQVNPQVIHSVLDILLEKFPETDVLLCGKDMAYVAESANKAFKKRISQYYYHIKSVKELRQVDDKELFKIAVGCPSVAVVDEVLAELNQALDDSMVPVSSGEEDIDIMPKGISKAFGINLLRDKWNISPEQLVAFGDSRNDLEMLDLAKYSYAMENAHPEVKQMANYQAPNNNQSGVLDVIEALLLN